MPPVFRGIFPDSVHQFPHRSCMNFFRRGVKPLTVGMSCSCETVFVAWNILIFISSMRSLRLLVSAISADCHKISDLLLSLLLDYLRALTPVVMPIKSLLFAFRLSSSKLALPMYFSHANLQLILLAFQLVTSVLLGF